MEARGMMQFTSGAITSLTITPAEKDPTCSLMLSADLTPEIAEKMGCRDSIYRTDGSPHVGPTRVDLGENKLRDIDLALPSPTSEGVYDLYRPELIYGFRVDREDETSNQITLHMRVRVKNKCTDLGEFCQKFNKDEFEFSIRSLQSEFDWSGSGGKGDRVDMSGRDGTGEAESKGPLFADTKCAHFAAGTQTNVGGGTHTLEDGSLVPCADMPVVKQEELLGPALVDAREMEGPRKKRQRTRGEMGEPTDEQIQNEEVAAFPVN